MISVIVPVYNAEKYLHRCVDSILAQTYSDFELLLIDDGSKDSSGEICDEYAQKDTRVRVFHKENGGVSSARNLGLDNARGEWVTFVDSDDWIDSHFLEMFSAQISNVDIIFGGINATDGSTWKLHDGICNVKCFLEEYIETPIVRAPWGLLLKTDILKRYNITFDPLIRYGEDVVFNLEYLQHCSQIKTIAYRGYYYFVGQVSDIQKYKLSAEEIVYSLDRVLSVKEKLIEKDCILDFNIDYCIYMNMYPIRKMVDNQCLVEYFNLCNHFEPTLNHNSFFNHCLFSPIIRGISELKALYERKKYVQGQSLFRVLCQLSLRNGVTIRFKNKDFSIWYWLIRHRCYFTLDVSLKFYFYLKSKMRH